MLPLAPAQDTLPEHSAAPLQSGTPPKHSEVPPRSGPPKQQGASSSRPSQAQLTEAQAAEDSDEEQDLVDSALPAPVGRADAQSMPGNVRKLASSADSLDHSEPEDLVEMVVDDASAANDETLPTHAPPIAPQHESSTAAKDGASEAKQALSASAHGKQAGSTKKKHK